MVSQGTKIYLKVPEMNRKILNGTKRYRTVPKTPYCVLPKSIERYRKIPKVPGKVPKSTERYSEVLKDTERY